MHSKLVSMHAFTDSTCECKADGMTSRDVQRQSDAAMSMPDKGVMMLVVLQVSDAEDTTQGGLLLAGSSKEKPTLGKVPAVDLEEASGRQSCNCMIS